MSDTAPRKAPQGKAAPAAPAAAEQTEAEQAETQVAGDQPADDRAKPDLDEVKRKFRAALDRKREVNAGDGSDSSDRGAGKIHGAHGPAAGRRSFRRKSG
jgi:uncharacterized protein DUF5302